MRIIVRISIHVLDVAVVLPPNKLFDGAFALLNTEEPKLFDGDAGVVPPKIDADDETFVAAFPPNILWADFAAADAKILPVDAAGAAVDAAGVDDRPKLANDNDVLSAGLAPKMFVDC